MKLISRDLQFAKLICFVCCIHAMDHVYMCSHTYIDGIWLPKLKGFRSLFKVVPIAVVSFIIMN